MSKKKIKAIIQVLDNVLRITNENKALFDDLNQFTKNQAEKLEELQFKVHSQCGTLKNDSPLDEIKDLDLFKFKNEEPIEEASPQELSEIEKLEIEIGQINYNIQIHESEILRIKSKENGWQPSAKDRYRDSLNKKWSIDFVAELKSRKAKLLEDYFNLTKQSKNV